MFINEHKKKASSAPVSPERLFQREWFYVTISSSTQLNRLLKGDRLIPSRKGVRDVSTRDVIAVMLSFGMYQLGLLTFIVLIMKHWFDMYDKNK